MPRPFQIACLLVFSSILSYSQEAPPVVTFTFDFPASQPEHYSIRIPSDGPAHYQSSGRMSADSDETDSTTAILTTAIHTVTTVSISTSP